MNHYKPSPLKRIHSILGFAVISIMIIGGAEVMIEFLTY